MSVANVLMIVGGLIGVVLAFRGLFRPFLGLVVLMTLHFIQPGELIPALAPLRLELIYGILMLVILLWTKASVIGELIKTDSIVRATIRRCSRRAAWFSGRNPRPSETARSISNPIP